MTTWNPVQYMKFGSDRLRPAMDLIAQIPIENISQLIDLGCGPGNVTHLLSQKWPDAKVKGLDASVHMLKQAKASYDTILWEAGNVQSWVAEEPVDLIFSNACLHWLGDHDVLFPRLLDQLKPDGVMAVQMPNNFSAPTHQLIKECLALIGREDLAPGFPVHHSDIYYDMLSESCTYLNIWETTYLHVLEGDNPVFNWTKGAALRPVLEPLDNEKDKDRFLENYARAIEKAYVTRADGKTLLPFKRFFMIAQKK